VKVPRLGDVEDVDVRADPATGAVESGILGTGLLDTHGGDAVEGRGEAYEEGGERFAYGTASYQRESVEMAGIVNTSTARLTLLWLS
jgi:hypothetical protein